MFSLRLGMYVFQPTLVPSIACALLVPILCSLGVWQLSRADEKRDIEQVVHAAMNKPALVLQHATPVSVRQEVYRLAVMSGRYDSTRQYLWDNKTHQGRPGFQVLTPFVLDETNQVVIVNRGWIPLLGRRDQFPDISVEPYLRKVRGVIKAPSNALRLSKQSDGQSQAYPRILQAFESQVIASELGQPVLPIMIELDSDEPSGYLRDWKPYYGNIGKHIGYAVQWFLMALIVAFLYVKLNLKRVEGG